MANRVLPASRSLRTVGRLLCTTWLALGGLLGCQHRAEIASYQAPKLERDKRPPAMPSMATEQHERMLAAMVQDRASRQMWFFKVTGSEAAVEKNRAAIVDFLKTVDFERGEPTWDAPADWQKVDGNEFRHATLIIENGPPRLECAVSKLPIPEQPATFILENLNRWRGQMGLPKIKDFEDQANLQGLSQVIGKHDVLLVDLSRPGDKGPAADAPEDVATDQAAPVQAAAPAAQDMAYAVPTGWKPGKAGAMRKAAFEVRQGDQKAEITVISAAGSLLANVNRWRGQINLPAIDEEQLAQARQPVKAGDKEGAFFVLEGPATEKPQSILAVVIPDGASSWFVKLQGDTPLARQEQARFLEFVSSLKFNAQ